MPSHTLNVGSLGRRFWGRQPGTLRALSQSDGEFEALVQGLVDDLDVRLGGCVVVAPSPSRPDDWRSRLRRLGQGGDGSLNPLELGAAAALGLAAREDGAIAFARVEFGAPRPAEPEAFLFAAEGRPILWIWLRETVDAMWAELCDGFDYPSRELAIDWDSLMPANLRLARELPRIGLHRGDAASWFDGERSLSFQAGLGVKPPEVYMPSAATWASRAPSWAAARRPEIVADFERAGVRVVAHDDGWVGGE